MEDMLIFIETLSLDDSLYWEIPSIKEDLRFEIVWKKELKTNPWRIRPKGAAIWTEVDRSALINKISEWDGDLAAFERVIGASIMTQAVFADQVIQGATKLFGQSAIEKGLGDARRFLENISKTIKEQTSRVRNKKRRNNLRVVSNDRSDSEIVH
jgi:hypothetical protein